MMDVEPTLLSKDEAIRRIRERDHTTAPRLMNPDLDEAAIKLIEAGVWEAALTHDGQLAFRPVAR